MGDITGDIHSYLVILYIYAELIDILKKLSMPHYILEDGGRVAEQGFILRHQETLGQNRETLKVYLQDDSEE